MNAIFKQNAYNKITKGSNSLNKTLTIKSQKDQIRAKVLTSLLLSSMFCGLRDVKSLQKRIPQIMQNTLNTLVSIRTSNFGAEAGLSYIFFRFDGENGLKGALSRYLATLQKARRCLHII